jgi:DNA-binding PadR family transcriptional regulator
LRYKGVGGMNEKMLKKYIPMTETAYYILLSLKEERHGYGILGHVEKITSKRLTLGAGTIYGTLSKLEKDNLISTVNQYDRRKTYLITETGKEILELELTRLQELVKNGLEVS